MEEEPMEIAQGQLTSDSTSAEVDDEGSSSLTFNEAKVADKSADKNVTKASDDSPKEIINDNEDEKRETIEKKEENNISTSDPSESITRCNNSLESTSDTQQDAEKLSSDYELPKEEVEKPAAEKIDMSIGNNETETAQNEDNSIISELCNEDQNSVASNSVPDEKGKHLESDTEHENTNKDKRSKVDAESPIVMDQETTQDDVDNQNPVLIQEKSVKESKELSSITKTEELKEASGSKVPKSRGRPKKIKEPLPSPPRLRAKANVVTKIVKSDFVGQKRPPPQDNIKDVKVILKKLKPSEFPSTSSESKSVLPKSKTVSNKKALQSLTHLPLRRYNLKFHHIPEIEQHILKLDAGAMRAFHKILFDRKFPTDEVLKNDILNFDGFPFKEKSDAFEKRKKFLKQMADAVVIRICKSLNLKKSVKNSMISDILKFLLKPMKTMLSPMDPFHDSMQPSVQLERMPIDKDYLSNLKNTPSSKQKKGNVESVASSSKQIPDSKLSKTPTVPEKKIPLISSKTNVIKKSSSRAVPVKKETSSLKKSVTPDLKKSINSEKKIVAPSTRKNNSSTAHKKSKTKSLSTPLKKVDDDSSPVTLGKRKRMLSTKLSSYKCDISLPSVMMRSTSPIEISVDAPLPSSPVKVTKTPLVKKSVIEEKKKPKSSPKKKVKPPSSSEPTSVVFSLEKLNNIKKEVDTSDEYVEMEHVPDEGEMSGASSEGTLSTEEYCTPKKRKTLQRVGKPLKTFPKIKESIERATFSSLQRLHILLFGASDKAENLKGNILAFGGFPFLENTDDWKQKEFLLSLLALNTLREYLNILCLSYGEEDQPSLIKKLMKFLAAPNDSNAGNEDLEIKTEVIYSEPSNTSEHTSPTPKQKKWAVKKLNTSQEKEKKKKPQGPTGKGRHRKVLMDEEQVKRLEAELAREQRALEREKRLKEEKYRQSLIEMTNASINKFGAGNYRKPGEIMNSPIALNKQTDAEQVQVLLQTVYRRRELKAAGAIISTPQKAEKTSLGDLPNIKFLVITANYNDLDVLHHLIYMTDSVKTRVRKNILDFAGFGFNEDSVKYKERMDFLDSLGYDIAKRIAFLLGLCPYKTDIEAQDLNELIMYFLMAPCKTSQVTIKDLPRTFFSRDMPQELVSLLDKHGESADQLLIKASENENFIELEDISNRCLEPPPGIKFNQRARKSMSGRSCLPVVRKPTLSPSISTLPLKSISPAPNSTNSPIQANESVTYPEFFVQTLPDGQQKTFKLIKMQPENTLYTTLKNQSVQSSVIESQPRMPTQLENPPITIKSPIPASLLPPGIIIFKNNPVLKNPESVQTLVQAIPNLINEIENKGTTPVILSHPPAADTAEAEKDTNEVILPDDPSTSALPSFDEELEEIPEVLNPLEDNDPPNDKELYLATKKIMEEVNSENFTLRNVVDKVFSIYPSHDLSHKINFIKSSIKKLILSNTDDEDD